MTTVQPPRPATTTRRTPLLDALRRHALLVLVCALVGLGRTLGLPLSPRAAAVHPYHPGRCAELLLDGRRIGLAGELHPRVISALGLPARTCAAEANLDVLVAAAAARGPLPAPVVSHFPPASVDVALVVAADVPAAEVEAALRTGAGDLLEDLRLFDVFTGPQVGEVPGEVHPVDHERHQIQLRQVRGQQLRERGLGLGDEPA